MFRFMVWIQKLDFPAGPMESSQCMVWARHSLFLNKSYLYIEEYKVWVKLYEVLVVVVV